MISEIRKQHIFGVAEFLKKYAEEKNLGEEVAKEYYCLGLLHDIGYEFLEPEDYGKHNKVGGELLKAQGYKYWKEVYYHGEPNVPYESELLDILNLADLHIDGSGNYVTFEKRLEEISKRYSTPYDKLVCKPLVDYLRSKGYN